MSNDDEKVTALDYVIEGRVWLFVFAFSLWYFSGKRFPTA